MEMAICALSAATHCTYRLVTCVCKSAPGHAPRHEIISRLPRYLFTWAVDYWFAGHSLSCLCVSTFNYEFRNNTPLVSFSSLRVCALFASVWAYFFCLSIIVSLYLAPPDPNFGAGRCFSSDGKRSPSVCVSLCNYFKLGAIARKRQQFCDIERGVNM